MLKYFSITVVFAFYSVFVFSQNNQVLPESAPEVGKPMPDFVLDNVKHYKSSSVSLKDFKGKWLFLDFWFTGCTVCIKSMKKVSDLQEQFKGKAQFMLVGVNEEELYLGKGIETLYEKMRIKQKLVLASAFDSALAFKWDIRSMPRIFIIDPSGIVRYITDGRDMTPDKIQEMIEGKNVSLYSADLERPSFVANSLDTSESLIFRSVLSKWKGETQRLASSIDQYLEMNQKQAYSVSGIWLEALYKTAFFGRCIWFRHEDIYQTHYPAVFLDGVDSSLFQCDFLTLKGLYNYDLIVPENQRNVRAVMKKMQDDLSAIFGYSASVEKRKAPVWLLVSNKGAEEKLRSKTDVFYTDWQGGSGAGGFIFKHATIDQFLPMLVKYIDDEKIPFYDATGIKSYIDIDMDADLTSIDDIRRVLQKNKLDLVKGEREMNVIVIREKYSDSANDFSGYWELNKQKSELNNFPVQMLDDDFSVKQTKDSIILTRNSTSPPISVEKLAFNGRPKTSVNIDNRTKIIKVQQDKETQKLFIEYWVSNPGELETRQYTFSQTWSLSKDKKSLLMEMKLESALGINTGVSVFDRK